MNMTLGEGGLSACLAYSMSQGVYLGATLEGSSLLGNQTDNEDYYFAEGITTTDILYGRIAPPSDPDAVALYTLLAQMTGSKPPPDHLRAASTKEKPLW